MKNSKAAELLFEEAKQHLESILHMIDHYNQIAEALVEMGYSIPAPNPRIEQPWPLPTLELSGNGCTIVDDASILDDFLEAGPLPIKKLRAPKRPRLVVQEPQAIA